MGLETVILQLSVKRAGIFCALIFLKQLLEPKNPANAMLTPTSNTLVGYLLICVFMQYIVLSYIVITLVMYSN